MKQTRSGKAELPQATSANAEFRHLRELFLERLRGEQSLLATLGNTLASANCDWPHVLLNTREFAHRLGEVALVSGYPEIGRAAKAVELAAEDAVLTREARRPGAALVSNMQILALLLAHATENKGIASRH